MTGWPRPLQIGVLLYACCGLVACFGPDGQGGFAAPDAGNAAGGAGGSGGSGDVGGVGGDPGLPVSCANMECPPVTPNPMLAGIFEPCCAPSGLCSLRPPGAECNELPDPDPRCGTLFVGKGQLPGCCGPDGLTCGVNLSVLGLDCVTADMLASFGIDVESRLCAPLEEDAGIDTDAGL